MSIAVLRQCATRTFIVKLAHCATRKFVARNTFPLWPKTILRQWCQAGLVLHDDSEDVVTPLAIAVAFAILRILCCCSAVECESLLSSVRRKYNYLCVCIYIYIYPCCKDGARGVEI